MRLNEILYEHIFSDKQVTDDLRADAARIISRSPYQWKRLDPQTVVDEYRRGAEIRDTLEKQIEDTVNELLRYASDNSDVTPALKPISPLATDIDQDRYGDRARVIRLMKGGFENAPTEIKMKYKRLAINVRIHVALDKKLKIILPMFRKAETQARRAKAQQDTDSSISEKLPGVGTGMFMNPYYEGGKYQYAGSLNDFFNKLPKYWRGEILKLQAILDEHDLGPLTHIYAGGEHVINFAVFGDDDRIVMRRYKPGLDSATGQNQLFLNRRVKIVPSKFFEMSPTRRTELLRKAGLID